jgi:hypothetical protein
MRQIDKMSYEVLLCRDLKHQWNPESADVTVIRNGVPISQMGLKCGRCGAEKDRWREDGRVRSRMRYVPEEYLFQIGRSGEPIGFLSAEEKAYITQTWSRLFNEEK